MGSSPIRGADIQERGGRFRVRVRVHPFYALTSTEADELSALEWGIAQVRRLRALHEQLTTEGRLPTGLLTRASASKRGLLGLIEGKAQDAAASPRADRNPAPVTSPGDNVTVHAFLDWFLEATKEHASDYRGRVRRLKNYFGDVPISRITTNDLEAYIAARRRGELGGGRSREAKYATRNREYERNRWRRMKGIPIVPAARTFVPPSDQSIRHELKILRLALTTFVARDDELRERMSAYVATHPICTVELPPPAPPRKRRVRDQEMANILSRISCPRKRAALLLGLYTSLRRREVLSLRAEDINWTECTVRLRAPQVDDPERPGEKRKQRKTKTVERDVPLIPEAVELLRGLCVQSEGLIFGFRPSSVTQAFGRAAEVAGVKDVRLHDLRREALSWLHDVHGLTLEQLTTFSGHTEVRALQKHYFVPDSAKLAARIAASGAPKRTF